MIVPSSKLLYSVAIVTLPAALLAAVAPTGAPVSGLLVMILGMTVAFDAWTTRKTLAGIVVELPPIARMSKDRTNKLEVRLRNELQPRQRLRVALGWPEEVGPQIDESSLTLQQASEWAHLSLPCKPTQRGRYLIDKAYIEGGSRLGLWATRKTIPVHSEIRVYPNLLTERAHLAAL